MFQKNHHFLFPQTHFGSFADLEEELFRFEEESSECILNITPSFILKIEGINLNHPNIGLYLCWTENNLISSSSNSNAPSETGLLI